ncbi:carbohydrate ABC transporter permease [Eubacteriales bacterium mix99]|jgi:putative aldouronate transport system permease protein
MAKNKLNQRGTGDVIFEVVNSIVMILLAFVTLYPMYYVVCASISDNVRLLASPGVLWRPKGFTMGAYKLAFSHPLLLSGYRNILFILVASLPLNIIMTLFCGYFLSSKNVYFKKPVMMIIMFTMFFSGGMIPGYLNVKSLGLYNSLWALILPGAMSVYNAIICKTAIEALPDSLAESAYIDGANDLSILFRIIFPLIMPTVAVLLLYYGVGHWNSWFPASLYIQDNPKLPIQNVLRAVLIANSNILNSAATEDDQINQFAETIKYAAIVITTVPVLCIYPFLQKYFVKGVMIGAVKG